METLHTTAPAATQGSPTAGLYYVTDMKVYTSLDVDAGALLKASKDAAQITATATGFTVTVAFLDPTTTAVQRMTMDVNTSGGGTPQMTLVCGSIPWSGFQYSVVSSSELWIYLQNGMGTQITTLKKQ